MEPAISVVIATIGRAEKLAPLARGVRPPPPGHAGVRGHRRARRRRTGRPGPWRTSRIAFHSGCSSSPRSGNGPAKNLGARHAVAPYLVFLNDDTRPDPGCLLAHLSAQERFGPCVLVGKVDWDPEQEITPYMRWLAPNGHQFNFSRLDADEPAHWDACWGAHLGLPREWHLEEPFDEAFPYPSLEDTEWGFRLARRGRPMRYAPDALCLHDHHYGGPADYRRRARTSGAATRHAVRRHPAMLWPLILRPSGAAVVASLAALWPGRWRRDTLWDLDFRWNLVWGIVTPQPQPWVVHRRS